MSYFKECNAQDDCLLVRSQKAGDEESSSLNHEQNANESFMSNEDNDSLFIRIQKTNEMNKQKISSRSFIRK